MLNKQGYQGYQIKVVWLSIEYRMVIEEDNCNNTMVGSAFYPFLHSSK